MGRLLEAIGAAPFVFVVGKGGVGKTTTAAALAVELSDAGASSHLISTDPAHSLQDVFGGETCAASLRVEEFAAAAYADAWLEHARPSLIDLVEQGTFLDAADVAAFTRLALPGVDELMGVLRLVDLAGAGKRVVVDTAPTGHTLRLLDASAIHEGVARALRSMADKAAAVVSSLMGGDVRLGSEALVDELDDYVRRYREVVLRPAAFILVARAGAVVEAETTRLAAALRERGLRTAATVWTGMAAGAPAGVCLTARLFADPPHGCVALRAWSAALEPCTVDRPVGERTPARPGAATGTPALPWLKERGLRLWLVAGKGGVGKTTCAAALASVLAEDRAVLLCSADPAGSLTDVLGGDAGASEDGALRLRIRQTDPSRELTRLRELYRQQVLGGLEGVLKVAPYDRRVIESLWELAPPGIDEVAALVTLLAAAESQETIVLDAAPTGHFLRLLEMPGLALDWTRQILRLILKYGLAAEGAEALLRFARELRALGELLRDEQRTGTLLVTLPEPVVAAESARLRERLETARVPVVAMILNRARDASVVQSAEISAPELRTAPIGVRALREFAATWKIVT